MCGGTVAAAITALLARADEAGAPPAVWIPDDDVVDAIDATARL